MCAGAAHADPFCGNLLRVDDIDPPTPSKLAQTMPELNVSVSFSPEDAQESAQQRFDQSREEARARRRAAESQSTAGTSGDSGPEGRVEVGDARIRDIGEE